MKIRKQESQFGTDIILEENDEDYLMITFGGNLDLYWTIHDHNESEYNKPATKRFTITKENYGVFHLFDKLFQDIDSLDVYDEEEEEFIPFCFDTEEEKREFFREQRERREEEKETYRKYNKSHYNDLYDKEHQTIEWYSDETAMPVANSVKIQRTPETFELTFSTQKHKEGYDRDFGTAYTIPIRFRNSGSRYDPLNIFFMKMYKALKDVDDVKDEGHQIHMDEYLFEQAKQYVKKGNQ